MKRPSALLATTAAMTLSIAAWAQTTTAPAERSVTTPPPATTSAPAPAGKAMSKNEYQAAKDRIQADAKSARNACDGKSGNAKDICQAQAKAKEKIDKAELEASYKNTAKARQDALVARADAEYAVAKEKCDDMSGKEKDACMKQAKAAQATAKTDAKTQAKTSAGRTSDKRG